MQHFQKILLITNLIMLFMPSSQFFFNTFHNLDYRVNRDIDNALEKLDKSESSINTIAQRANRMIDSHKSSISNYLSSSMFDDIMGGFGFSRPSGIESDKKEQMKENEESKTGSFSELDLENVSKKMSISPLFERKENNSLEVIVENPNQNSDDKNTIENKSPFKNRLKRWRMTTRSGHKTSALTKASSSNPWRSSSRNKFKNKRNLIMGIGQQNTSSEVDLNSLFDHLQNKNSSLNSFLPKDLTVMVKDPYGNLLDNFMPNEPEPEVEIVPYEGQQWTIDDMVVKRNMQEPEDKESLKYARVDYKVENKSNQ
jgi:hypothetical protein